MRSCSLIEGGVARVPGATAGWRRVSLQIASGGAQVQMRQCSGPGHGAGRVALAGTQARRYAASASCNHVRLRPGAKNWGSKKLGKQGKTLELILLGRSDANIGFADLRALLLAFGFCERVRGDHHIFYREGVEEILNLQPRGAQAKPYQVRQVRSIILKYKLEL